MNLKRTTICFTGHRPKDLNGYEAKDNRELLWTLQREIIRSIEEDGVTEFINGVALGIDQWAALIVINLKRTYSEIRLVSAVPCLEHNNKWLPESKKIWQYIINNSDEVVQITNEKYTPSCMQKRNVYMVDRADKVLSVWNGNPGGTGNCIKYARSKNKEIKNVNPLTLKVNVI